MIVEFVGCTGAGKTSLARDVGAHTGSVVGDDLVLDHPGLRHVSNATAVNLFEDVAGLPHVIRSRRQHTELLLLCAAILRRHAPSRFDRVMSARSVLRRLGMYELARNRPPGRAVLLDEGPLLIAAHLFVYSSAPVPGWALDRFAELVPLADRIVHVRAPLETLQRRAITRTDQRRQFTGLSDEAVAASVRRSATVFDLLAAAPRLRGRVLVVDNTDRRPRTEVTARLVEQLGLVPHDPGVIDEPVRR